MYLTIFWVDTKNVQHNDSATIFICFQKLIKIWSFSANIDFSIVATEDQKALYVKVKSILAQTPQVVVLCICYILSLS